MAEAYAAGPGGLSRSSPGDPSRNLVMALLGLGMVAMLGQGMLPILLGYLATAGRLSSGGIGEAAAIETYALTLTAALAGLVLRPSNLRRIAFISATSLVAVNLVLLALSSETQILTARGVAGIAEGLLFWIALEAIARSPLPERSAGIMNAGALVASLCAANLLNIVVLPRYGVNGAFALLALMSGGGIVLSGVIPRSLASRSHGGESAEMPRPHGWLVLLAIGLFNAAGMGFGIYIVPLAVRSGLAPEVAGEALVALIVGQLAGSALAAVSAGRLTSFAVLMICTAAYACTWPFYAAHLSAMPFILLAGSLGLVTFVAVPFEFSLAADTDPGSRTAVLAGPACLLGAATGPLFSAWTVNAYGLDGLLYLGFALLLPAVLLVIFLHVRHGATLPLTR